MAPTMIKHKLFNYLSTLSKNMKGKREMIKNHKQRCATYIKSMRFAPRSAVKLTQNALDEASYSYYVKECKAVVNARLTKVLNKLSKKSIKLIFKHASKNTLEELNLSKTENAVYALSDKAKTIEDKGYRKAVNKRIKLFNKTITRVIN